MSVQNLSTSTETFRFLQCSFHEKEINNIYHIWCFSHALFSNDKTFYVQVAFAKHDALKHKLVASGVAKRANKFSKKNGTVC